MTRLLQFARLIRLASFVLLIAASASAQTWGLVTTPDGWKWELPGGTPINKYVALSLVDDGGGLNHDCPGNLTSQCAVYGKFGSSWPNWALATSARLMNLGFTAIGQYGYRYAAYWVSDMLPYAPTTPVSTDAMRYYSPPATSYNVKDATFVAYGGAIQCKISAGGFGGTIYDGDQADPYDPKYQAAATYFSSTIISSWGAGSPASVMVVFPEEGDTVFGLNLSGSHTDLGYLVAANAPFQKVSKSWVGSFPGGYQYTDQTRYDKLALRDYLLNKYLCIGPGSPVATCTGAGTGTGSADPSSASYVGATNAANALTALNAAWTTGYTTWNTSDPNGLSGIQNGTYTSWGGVAACTSSGVPYSGCTGAETGTGITQGTGLLDEAGYNILTNQANCHGATGNGPTDIDAWSKAPQIETDLHGFVARFAATYAKGMQTAYQAANCSGCGSSRPPEFLPLYDPPSYVAEAVAPYFNGLWTNPSTAADAQRIIDGDGGLPIIVADYSVTGPDDWASLYGSPSCAQPSGGQIANCVDTQSERAAQMVARFREMLKLKNNNGKYAVVGIEHWGYWDGSNLPPWGFGLFTPTDNGYDGSQASETTSSAWSAAHSYTQPTIVQDSNGNYESLAVPSCTTGATVPAWPAAAGSTSPTNPATYQELTKDGGCLWFNDGTWTRKAETPMTNHGACTTSTQYTAPVFCKDSNSNYEVLSADSPAPCTSNSSPPQPPWPTSSGVLTTWGTCKFWQVGTNEPSLTANYGNLLLLLQNFLSTALPDGYAAHHVGSVPAARGRPF